MSSGYHHGKPAAQVSGMTVRRCWLGSLEGKTEVSSKRSLTTPNHGQAAGPSNNSDCEENEAMSSVSDAQALKWPPSVVYGQIFS